MKKNLLLTAMAALLSASAFAQSAATATQPGLEAMKANQSAILAAKENALAAREHVVLDSQTFLFAMQSNNSTAIATTKAKLLADRDTYIAAREAVKAAEAQARPEPTEIQANAQTSPRVTAQVGVRLAQALKSGSAWLHQYVTRT